MCGITGFISGKIEKAEMKPQIDAMSDALTHRGPDQGGRWVDEERGVALGHRRLSILDLSEAGAQPMTSQNGRFVLVYNGEIYNHRQIRNRLRNVEIAWRGHSDTETLVESIAHLGLKKTVSLLNGMFAFALWDREYKELTLVRDRMGIKPLYYGLAGNQFVFGSELKALLKMPGWALEMDQQAISALFTFGYIPDPLSIFKGIYKLPPASLLRVGNEPGELPDTEPYWDAERIFKQGFNNPINGRGEGQRLAELENLLADSVEKRMISDVPLGAFLSGGFDSSVITALMQRVSTNPVQTFSIGFEDPEHDESPYAREIATYLGTDHHEHRISKSDLIDVVPKIPLMYDEPFADSSQIPVHILSQVAKRNVTVALSGDGADELFAGYNRHFAGPDTWNKISFAPHLVRRGLSALINRIPISFQVQLLRNVKNEYREIPHLDEKLLKINRLLASKRAEDFMEGLIEFSPGESLLADHDPGLMDNSNNGSESLDPLEYMLYIDLVRTLPGDMLVKVDRASMGCSLEVRVPFLDHRLVEFATQLPLHDKISDGEGKQIIKKLGYKLINRELLDRPKKGFQVPIDQWIRNDLHDWAQELLQFGRIKRQGIFDPHVVQRLMSEHVSKKKNHKNELWCCLMVQSWIDEYM